VTYIFAALFSIYQAVLENKEAVEDEQQKAAD